MTRIFSGFLTSDGKASREALISKEPTKIYRRYSKNKRSHIDQLCQNKHKFIHIQGIGMRSFYFDKTQYKGLYF